MQDHSRKTSRHGRQDQRSAPSGRPWNASERACPDQIVPDDFVRWIFPALVAHRRPKYEAMAKRCGYTLNARLAEGVTNEQDFLELVAGALDR